MNSEVITKAPKDKTCPYCGQSFTSSSLGRHLDLYIKDRNPKAPDGVHDVVEIRKLRGTITRRHPRGGSRRNTASSAAAGSQTGSRRSPTGSDGDSVRSPEEGDIGAEKTQKGHPQRVFNRQTIKSSLEVRQRVQDALDTARAAELALREMISSWRAVKHSSSLESMPFDVNPLSLDFPGLCLQFLEPPPTLYSSTPHTISTSWSISPPDQQQRNSLAAYFREEFKKWKASCIATAAATAEEIKYQPSYAMLRQEEINKLVHRAEEAAVKLEKQVAEHLSNSYQTWDGCSAQQKLELWSLEMARNIGKKRMQVNALQETQYTLKQENANLRSQLDNLNRENQPREFKIIPPMTLRVNAAMGELWAEAGAGSRLGVGSDKDGNHTDVGALVSGAIERWKSVVVASRTASGMHSQRDFDHTSAPLKTPTSATYPMTPEVLRSTHQRSGSNAFFSHNEQSSPNRSETDASTADTPTQLLSDSDEDVDADAEEDMDAEADIEMVQNEFLSSATPSTHQAIAQMPQLQTTHMHTAHLSTRTQGHDVTLIRHGGYPQRSGTFVTPNIVPSQQVPMSQQVFNHQMQNLTHHLSQGHAGVSMGWEGQ